MFKIAFRNVLRNGRRSLMTASALAIGAAALILFGEYNGMAKIGMETGTIHGIGHLTVFKKGYYEFGSGRPLDYSISGYEKIISLIRNDPVLKGMLNVVTPTVSVYGIAGNSALDKSKTFFGSGIVPSDQDKMNRWDEYQLYNGRNYHVSGLKDGDVTSGVVGRGLARILGLCRPLKLKDCPEQPGSEARGSGGTARLELLGSAGGAPNIVSFNVTESRGMGDKTLDDSYIGMHLALAQQLLYGAGEHKVSAIVLQLHRTEDMAAVRARLAVLFAEHHLDLEVRDFKELSPAFGQIMNFLSVLFGFLAVILGIIVAFTVANTMSMSVMERTNEIGTARAMGVRRGGIRRQFLLEGAILGMFGSTAGLVLGAVCAQLINHAGITYTAPGDAQPIQLYLQTHHVTGLFVSIWLVLTVLAALASIIPSGRAAKMKVVDALRHV